MDHNHPVVTRFAPSPTGFMHIGSVRTALYAYLYAKRHHGTFILRIEDTDKEREVAGSIAHIMESLTWLGINWDFGPDTPGPFGSCIQSERLATYNSYAEQLVAKGHAYPDPYTQEELEAFRAAAIAEKRPFLYRDHRPDTFTPWDGTQPLRLKVPEVKRMTWHDAVRGELSAGPEMLDDIILMKADGYPTYNFAHIIDDLEMGVTHIMRGDEFISSTPKFLSIYEALGIQPPVFATLPPILRDDKTKKLGKRDGAKDILDYRSEGYLPEALVNFLALIGWNPGTEQEIFTREELIAAFSLEQIQRSGGVFNEEKLQWMNKVYLSHLTTADFASYLSEGIPDTFTAHSHFTEIIQRLAPTIQERIHTRAEALQAFTAGEYDFAFAAPAYDVSLLKWKNDENVEAALPRLLKLTELLTTADFTTPETIKAAIWEYAESIGKGEVLWPLRVALSGRERSPDPFTLAHIIGQPQTLERIRTACDKIEGNGTT